MQITFGNDKCKKIMIKSCSVFHTEQKMEFEKFNCFFVGFSRSSLGGIKVMSTVVERGYTPDITRHICFAYQLTGLYDKRFYWTVFPIVLF